MDLRLVDHIPEFWPDSFNKEIFGPFLPVEAINYIILTLWLPLTISNLIKLLSFSTNLIHSQIHQIISKVFFSKRIYHWSTLKLQVSPKIKDHIPPISRTSIIKVCRVSYMDLFHLWGPIQTQPFLKYQACIFMDFYDFSLDTWVMIITWSIYLHIHELCWFTGITKFLINIQEILITC